MAAPNPPPGSYSNAPPPAYAPPGAQPMPPYTPAGPGMGPSVAAPPKKSRSGAMIAVIAVVVIAVVIIALIFTGIIPLLHSSSSSGGGGGGGGSSSGEPYSQASPQAAAAASSYASGPWATIIAAGLVSPTQVTASTTNITGSTNCTVSVVHSASLTLPATTSSVTSGNAAGWAFIYYKGGSSPEALEVIVLSGTATVLAALTGKCLGDYSGITGVSSNVIDSPAATAAVQSNASAFLSNHTTGVSATYLLIGGFGALIPGEAGAEWHIAYSTCALENPKGTGAEFDSDVNATSGKVLFSSTLYQLSCGGGSTGGGGGGGGGGNPLSSSYGMTESTSPTLIGTTWTTNVTPYSLNKTLTYGDLAFSVNNTTMVTPGAGWNITVWNTSTLSGIPTLVASYTFATWTNATQLVGFYDTMVIGTGTYDPGGNTFLATGATGTGLTGDVSLKLAAGNGAGGGGQKNLANDLYMGWDGPPTDNYSMPDYLTNFTAYANISLTYGELNFSVTTQSGSPVAPSAAWNVTIWNATTGEVAAYYSFTDAKWLLNGTGPIGTYDTIEVSTGTTNPVGDILVATPTATSGLTGHTVANFTYSPYAPTAAHGSSLPNAPLREAMLLQPVIRLWDGW
ncbi:MAG: hypothetical protein WCA77_06350 [Thermoplasmata archaeon]